MNHLAYRHEDEERCVAAPLSIFEANLRLKPDEECSIANPAAWSTTPDFIGAKMLKSGELIEDKISQSYMLWASWPNVSVHLIYNFFYGDSIKDLVESGAKTAVRDDSTLGFACWNDMQWNKHLPGSMLSVDVTTNLLISCYYDVQLKFDLNGGYMKTGSPAAQTCPASRYLDTNFEEVEEPAEFMMPSETPLKNDGSFFKWWDLDDCIMQQDETAFLMQNAVATAKYHFNATYSFNDSVNISGAGTIASSSEVDSGDVIKKTFSANANDGYMFQRWDIESFDGSKTSKSTSQSSRIDVSMNKLQSSEKQVNAYVNVLAVFAVDSSWTTSHYGDGTMKTFRVSGIASNDVLHVKGDISVTKVVFGKTVTGLESELFSGCIMLRDVIMHSGMWQFGNGVFDGCTALANISFS